MKALEKGEKLRMVEAMLENVRVAIAKQAAETGEDADTELDEAPSEEDKPKTGVAWIDDDED